MFPRLTLLFSSVASGGFLWWVGWLICPKLLVAILSLGYWDTNPIMVVGAWLWAFSGNDSGSSSSSGSSSGTSSGGASNIVYDPPSGPSFSPSFSVKNVTATGGLATAVSLLGSVKVSAKESEKQWCPYCHGSVTQARITNKICGRCGAEHHRDCWDELHACSSCGSGY